MPRLHHGRPLRTVCGLRVTWSLSVFERLSLPNSSGIRDFPIAKCHSAQRTGEVAHNDRAGSPGDRLASYLAGAVRPYFQAIRTKRTCDATDPCLRSAPERTRSDQGTNIGEAKYKKRTRASRRCSTNTSYYFLTVPRRGANSCMRPSSTIVRRASKRLAARERGLDPDPRNEFPGLRACDLWASRDPMAKNQSLHPSLRCSNTRDSLTRQLVGRSPLRPCLVLRPRARTCAASLSYTMLKDPGAGGFP